MFLEIASIHASALSLSCYSAYRQWLADISSKPLRRNQPRAELAIVHRDKLLQATPASLFSLSHATAPASGAPPVAYIGLGLCWRSNISFKLQSMGVLYSAPHGI